MVNLRVRIELLMFAAALLAVVGCGTTRPSNFYQLNEPAAIRLSGLERGLAVGVGPINLPPYLDRPQIVVRGAGQRGTPGEALPRPETCLLDQVRPDQERKSDVQEDTARGR